MLKYKYKSIILYSGVNKMLTYKKDDFDESLEDIMKSVQNIIAQNTEENKEDDKNKDDKDK